MTIAEGLSETFRQWNPKAIFMEPLSSTLDTTKLKRAVHATVRAVHVYRAVFVDRSDGCCGDGPVLVVDSEERLLGRERAVIRIPPKDHCQEVSKSVRIKPWVHVTIHTTVSL